jgi:outer membrane protein assembly factor BamD
VQEVLAEREFEIGRFYYLKMSYPASIARLQSLGDKYPLYSRADEALYLLGQNYEGQIARIRLAPTCTGPGTPQGCAGETFKANLIADYTKKASNEYDQIITRYPIMDRVDDAKKRLATLHQPIPRPTKADVARNKAEDASRRDSGTYGRLVQAFMKHPDVGQATKVGEPPLVDPTPIAANEVVRNTLQAGMGTPARGEKSVGVEVVGTGAPAANDPAPRSDAPAGNGSPFAQPPAAADANELKPAAPADSNELKPDPNELKPTADSQSAGEAALPPPPQVNEIQPGSADSSPSAGASSSSNSEPASDKDLSSSKKKKKKGLKRIVPF